MRDQTFMKLMALMPKSALSSLAGWASRAEALSPLHRWAMRAFARKYGVSVEEAEHGFEGYPTFAEFFSRRLKEGMRPIDARENIVVSPVDGTVSQAGYAAAGECIQAKGIRYPLGALLGSEEAASPFKEGAFATLYLAPRDYHRIHAPLNGKIEGYAYIPGEFWPVNPRSVRARHALFCRNERLITFLSTGAGPCAVVKVGATCVARIRASYGEVVTHSGKPGEVHRFAEPIPVNKGDELGAFEMGSTVILLFQQGRVRWDDALVEGSRVRMGQRIGVLT
ncbi:MAG TPA: archaetidylserine decarboxylase [Myxococcaceae bacterium]|nr:archaetidylserine decarboxylase [Myxococcaceae bacterium]